MRTPWASYVRYEVAVLRQSRSARWIAAGALAVSVAATSVALLSADRYLELSNRDHWALVATQGGTVGMAPLFAYLLALHGVLVWSQDVRGESAYVAHLSFSSRARLAVVRTFLLAGTAALVSLACQLLVVLTSWACFGEHGLASNLVLVGVKTAWAVTCGVGLALIGALACVLVRAPVAAVAVLLVIPWLVEPVVIQLLDLVPALRPVAWVADYLPFSLTSDLLRQPERPGSLTLSPGRVDPRDAALLSAAMSSTCAAVAVWSYQARDEGTR